MPVTPDAEVEALLRRLAVCRALYTLAHGRQTSKKQAALWAQARLPR